MTYLLFSGLESQDPLVATFYFIFETKDLKALFRVGYEIFKMTNIFKRRFRQVAQINKYPIKFAISGSSMKEQKQNIL